MAYNQNVPAVPELNVKLIISKIENKVQSLELDEKESIINILLYHSCEPSAAAERISELLQVDYSAIFDLL